MYVASGDASVQVTLYPGLITVYQANGSVSTSASFSSNSTLDGDWHTLSISLHPTGLQVTVLSFFIFFLLEIRVAFSLLLLYYCTYTV